MHNYSLVEREMTNLSAVIHKVDYCDEWITYQSMLHVIVQIIIHSETKGATVTSESLSPAVVA